LKEIMNNKKIGTEPMHKDFMPIDENKCMGMRMKNNFFTLVGFEYKKIFKRKSTYLSFLMIAIVIVLSFGIIIGDTYVEGDKGISKYELMNIDREYSRSVKGYIDENKIKEIIEQNKVLLSDIENSPLSNGEVLLSKGTYEKFSMRYSYIARLFRNVYAPKGESFNYDAIDKLSDEDAKLFYNKRLDKIDEMLSNGYFTETEIRKYHELNFKISTPFYFDHYKGYSVIMQSLVPISIFATLAISICIAPIFASEYSGKTDQLILTSKFGKNKLINAKIFSGITFSFIVSSLTVCITILSNLLIFGFDGANVELQVMFPLMPYPLTMLEAVIVMSIVSLMATLLVSTFTMFMSSKLKNPFGVIIITNIILFAPMFISIPENNRVLATIIRLLPVKMFEISDVFSEHFFVFGDFAGAKSFTLTSYVFLPVFCFIVCILLIPFTYRAFKKHQIS